MMARIFSSFVVAQLILFAVSAAIGVFGSGEHTSRHVLLAILALLLSCLTQVGLFTYFTVTGKMVVQAVHLGRLERGPLVRVTLLKRSVTRPRIEDSDRIAWIMLRRLLKEPLIVR